MTTLISDLAQNIVESKSFKDRYQKIQSFAGKHRLGISQPALENTIIDKLLLQISVLALSEELIHRHIAQNINSLIDEVFHEDALISYAVQVITSRLGNFPVISESSQVFGQNNIFNILRSSQESDNAYVFDSEIIRAIYSEEDLSSMNINNSILHFNIFQKEILNALQNKSLVSFSAPTSFGKSFIVRHHIARMYSENQLNKVLIIVPTKSLIDDFYSDLLQIKKDLRLDFSILTHARTVQNAPENVIFILTQERLSYLLNKNPEYVKGFQLVYCDEAHYISRGYRGFLLTDVLQKVYSLCGIAGVNGNTKYIFSSPIIKNPQYYKYKIFPLIDATLTFHKEIKFSPVEKNIHLILKEAEGYRYHFLRDTITECSFDDKLEEIGFKSASLLSENTTLIEQDIDAILSLNLPESSILFTTSPVAAHNYAEALASRLTVRNNLDSDELIDLKKYIQDHYHPCFGLIEYIKKGIGLHYGPMPIGLRRVVVDLFERKIIKYILCTATLLEGVNLPAKNIFLFSNKCNGKNDNHSTLSFWNLIGRAGRITYGLAGNVFCIGEKVTTYKNLIENTETEVNDPEIDVANNPTKTNHIKNTFLDPHATFKYLKSPYRKDIEYIVYELLISTNPERILHKLRLDDDITAQIMSSIISYKTSFSIPIALIKLNSGIDPRLQNSLHDAFCMMESDSLIAYYSITDNPYTITSVIFERILQQTASHFQWPKYAWEVTKTSSRITQWIHEFPISDFIQQSISHLNQLSNIEIIDRAIKVIRDVDTELSYNAPKYLKCFYDILLFVLQSKGIVVDIEKVESFLYTVESGISSSIGKVLFERGVSRPVAIKANALLSGLLRGPVSIEEIRQADARDILERGMSGIAFNEITEHLL